MIRARTVATIALLAAACGGGARPSGDVDDRLSGEWEIALTRSPSGFGAGRVDTATVRGRVAFLPNRSGGVVSSFGGVPRQVGTHNVRLDRLVPDIDPRAALPLAAGSSAGDSVRIVLDPGDDEPLVLRGAWRGAMVAGAWVAHHRAGIDQEGRFTMRRPPP